MCVCSALDGPAECAGDVPYTCRMVRACVLAACVCLWMCAARGTLAAEPAPLSAINDAKAHTGTQIKAIRRAWQAVAEGEADGAEVREQLKKAAWARSRFYEVRLAALEALLADEPNLADTRNMMRLMLPTETQWQVIEMAGDTAATRGWTDLTTALVRCWARPVDEPSDAERPERRALERLHPGRGVEDVVFGVFVGESALGPEHRGMADSREREQQDAWALLRRLDGSGERTKALLSRSDGSEDDETLAVLRAAARDLGVIPDSADEVAWLSRLRGAEHEPVWSECADAVARLTEEARRDLSPRHLMGLRWAAAARPELFNASREELLTRLDETLKPRKRHVRPSAVTAGRRQPESLRTWRERMTWGDALLALIAAELVADQGLAAVLFAQADEDRADTSTEHGGVIDGGGGACSLRLFPPRPAQRYGDRRFVASPDMIEQGVDAIFHYHLHCTSYDNSDYSGPSDDDLAYAKRQGRACLVFTFINKRTLNADYYQGDGVTLDLGTLKRPE